MDGKKKSSLAAEGGAEEAMAAAAAASPAAILAFLARPLTLLRHVAHGCVGYLGGLASRLKPAAAADATAACQPQQEKGSVVEAATVVTEEVVMVEVEVRSRGMAPQRRMREAGGGKGGAVH